MPIYEYQCPKCGVFEVTQRITESALKRCPTCKAKVERILSRTSFVLKGSGWYATDYARAGSKTESSTDSTAGNGGANGSSSTSDSSTKSDTSKSSDTSAKSESTAKSESSAAKSSSTVKSSSDKNTAGKSTD